jgi:type II secretory pathway pseudopilin PulG
LAIVMRVNEISWPRILAEGVAIVVSILLAFAIDRWWDARQARQEEIAALTPLLDELQRLQSTLSDNDEYHAAIQLSARRLIAAGNGQGEALGDAEIDRLLCDQLWYSSPENLATPELDFLADSGDLDLVRDMRLRRAIGALPYSLASARRPMEREYDFFMNRLLPHLARYSAMPQIWNVNCHRPGNPAAQVPYGARLAQGAHVSHRALVEEREFQGLMTARIDILAEAQSSADLKEAIADCIRQVEQSLQSD